MRMLGIDPGSASPSGAVYQTVNTGRGSIVEAFDIPMTGEENQRRVDVFGLVDLIEKWGVTHATIELVNAMPSIPDKVTGIRRQMGGAGMGRFMAAFGDLRTTVRLCGFEPLFAHPVSWKKFHGLKGPDKEQSRQLAIELFPAMAHLLKRKKDEGRAEAMLIARYGAHKVAAA